MVVWLQQYALPPVIYRDTVALHEGYTDGSLPAVERRCDQAIHSQRDGSSVWRPEAGERDIEVMKAFYLRGTIQTTKLN